MENTHLKRGAHSVEGEAKAQKAERVPWAPAAGIRSSGSDAPPQETLHKTKQDKVEAGEVPKHL